MLIIKQSESTAARRRVPVVLVDDTDGKTAETGVTLSAGDMKISKNGGAEANHAGTLTELAGGDYYYEFTESELDTVGYITGRIVKAGVRTFRIAAQVVAFDPYDAAGLGLSRVDADVSSRASQTSVDAILVDTAEIGAAGAGLSAVPWNASWDAEVQSEVADALGVYDPPTKAELDTAVGLVTIKTDNLPSDPADQSLIIAATDAVMARLGAPAGASISADIAATKAQAAEIETDTQDIQSRLPAALVGGRMDSTVEAIDGDTNAPTHLKRAVLGTVIGTVGAASTTTSIVTSSLTPAAAVADQFIGRIVVFDKDTTTANLRGQATDITASSIAGVLTVTALTTAPASGDTFTIQ